MFTDSPFLDFAPILSFEGHVMVVAVSSIIYETYHRKTIYYITPAAIM